MKNILIITISFLLILVFSPELSAQNWKELDSIGKDYFQNGDYENAYKVFEKALKQAGVEFGKNDSNYAKALYNLAEVLNESGKYDKAESLYLDAVKIIKKALGEKHPDYTESLNSLSVLYKRTGKYDKAEKLCKEALNIKKEIFGEKHISYATSLNNLAELYHDLGQYDKAEKLYKDALNIKREILGDKHPDYATTLNNLGTLYDDMGQFNVAEPLYKEVMKIDKEALGEKHSYYASDLNNLGALYFKMGQYEKSEPLYLESVKINKEILGNKHPEYAISLNNLAELYRVLKKFKEAELLNQEVIKIRKEVFGEKHPIYARSLNNLATLYSEIGQNDKSKSLYEEALKIDKIVFGEKHVNYAMDLNNLAGLLRSEGKYADAETLYSKEVKIFKEALGEKHPYYAASLYNLAMTYSSMMQNEKAESLFAELSECISEQLRIYYPSLSEYEKAKFIKSIEDYFDGFYSFGIKRFSENNSFSKEVIELRNNTKGLILSSASNIRKRITESKNQELIEEFNKLLSLRTEIGKIYSKTIEEQKEKGINLTDIERQANELEKEISLKSENFKSDLESKYIKYNDIQNALKENEAAVEFIDFRYYDKRWTDTTYFCAIVLKRDIKYPILIKLCTLDDLKEYIYGSADSRNSFVRNDEKSTEVYKLVWKPIEEYLIGVENIFVSRSGILNKISFVSLKADEQNLLIDKYKIRYVGNLKDIVLNVENKKNNSERNAVVFGGIKFDMDSSEMISNSLKYISEEKNIGNNPEISTFFVEETDRSGWGYLSGTLIEAEKIKDLLVNNGYETRIYTNIDGNEETFKSISGLKSPAILHISTHGFFNPEPEKNYNKTGIIEGKDVYNINNNPLFRSGLIFAGANRIWKGGGEIEGIENGILTAYEVANMDLMNTELVVLSACETGLGDILGGEGVYGLQRAFRVAGAKTIIMSLWKVPDKETVELMELFYTNWLGGMTKHEAFTKAQKEMRKKYSPYYWAAFVMVE